jgi:hypothetical protein
MARTKSAEASAPANGATPKRGEKTAAIRQLYREGVRKAGEINTRLQERGLSVSMPVIYTTLKEMKGGRGRKRGKKARAAAKTTTASVSKAPASSGLSANDLGQLAAIAQKAGGVDAVVDLLNAFRALK